MTKRPLLSFNMHWKDGRLPKFLGYVVAIVTLIIFVSEVFSG